MEDEKLIECVRKYEFLYNLQHPKYMDTVKKQMAWKEISEQLKQPAAACKQRWQGLRDAYRRALNKKKGRTGQAAKNIKKWKYEEEMSFVASFIVEKRTMDSVELSSEGEEFQDKDAATEVQNPSSPCQSIKKAKVLPLQSASAVLMSRLLDEQAIPQQREYDELDRFFLNISETVKKFSPYLQAMAKNKIFTLVSVMELQQLAPPNSKLFEDPEQLRLLHSKNEFIKKS